jgi:hypothetical protein
MKRPKATVQLGKDEKDKLNRAKPSDAYVLVGRY